MHKSGNIGINANFVFPYICSFLLHLHHLMFVNVNFNVSGCKLSMILFTYNGMSWQYWRSCIVDILWKLLLIAWQRVHYTFYNKAPRRSMYREGLRGALNFYKILYLGEEYTLLNSLPYMVVNKESTQSHDVISTHYVISTWGSYKRG